MKLTFFGRKGDADVIWISSYRLSSTKRYTGKSFMFVIVRLRPLFKSIGFKLTLTYAGATIGQNNAPIFFIIVYALYDTLQTSGTLRWCD